MPSLIGTEQNQVPTNAMLGSSAYMPYGQVLTSGAGITVLASASTTDIGTSASNVVQITGTTTITALGNAAAGAERTVIFAGALTLTHNATSLILPSAANITTAAGDAAKFVSLGSGNWDCVSYQTAAASQAEAEAGTDNHKPMTALRVSQAISSQVVESSQAQAEAGVDNATVMTPLRVSQAISALATTTKLSSRTSNTILAAVDAASFIDITSGTFTQTFTAAATLGNKWWCYIRNSGTGNITLDPNASETIDGVTSFIMYPNETRLILCNATSFISSVITPMAALFTSSGTFTKPPGYPYFRIEMCGAGGGGGGGSVGAGDTTRRGSCGGGGGAFQYFTWPSMFLSASETVTCGAGGTAGAVGANGGNGGNTTFSTITVYGGGGGAQDVSSEGGGGAGGGWLGAAALSSPANGTLYGGLTANYFDGASNSASTYSVYGGSRGNYGGTLGNGNASASTQLTRYGGGGGGSSGGAASAATGTSTAGTGPSGVTGGAAGTSGGNGAAGTYLRLGGGGGGSRFTAGTAGAGGVGGPGAGGGAGGSSYLGTGSGGNAGTGGAGGNGYVLIIGVI
jgi:hypothetical protein